MTRYWRISIPCALGELRVPRLDGRTLKPTTIAFEAAARLTSFSVIPPTPVWITLTRTSECSIFASSPTIASTEPCTSPLRTRFRSATPPACICAKSVLERDAAARLLRERLAAQPLAALLRELARAALVLDHARQLAGRRRLVEAEDLDRRRPGRPPRSSRRGSRRARGRGPRRRRRRSRRRPCSVPRWTSIVATGPRPTSRRDSMIGPEASAFGFAVSSSSSVGDEQDLLEQLVEALALLGRDLRDLRRPAPLLGLQALGGEVASTRSGFASGQVDLVDGDDDRHARPRARARSTRASAA